MKHEDLAKKIYLQLNEDGARLGTASIGIIESVITDFFAAPLEGEIVIEKKGEQEDFCTCEFVMVMRDRNDVPYCSDCGKYVKEI